MGIVHPLLFLSPSSTLYYLGINPTKTSVNPTFSSEFRCSFSSRPRWDPNRFGFGFEEEFGFGRGVREKRRNWWSDDEDDDDDDDDEFGFGFWEEPSAIDWFFKILGAFGWMIPAVIISALFGTGSNSLIMALVLPLGQTALSLVMEKLWGGPSSNPDPRPRPKTRRRRNPSVGSAYGSKESKGGARGPRTGTRQMNGSYKSWGGANSSSSATKSGSSKFGGWDELDELSNGGVPKEGQNRKAEGLGRENRIENVKLSVRRKRERPLFLRLLIAVFPFLGSWSRFLF